MGRENLEKIYGERAQFTAKLGKFGKKRSKTDLDKKTVLLENIKHNGREVSDHLWIDAGKWCEILQVGDEFIFSARVVRYTRLPNRHADPDGEDYDKGAEEEYTLHYPHNVFRLNFR